LQTLANFDGNRGAGVGVLRGHGRCCGETLGSMLTAFE
jgi:hypothetical protein